PANNTASEFADKLIDTLLGNEVTAQQKASAHDLIVGKLNAGEARSDVIVDAVQLLLNAPGEKWADAKTALLNKVEVSSYYSVDAQQNSNSLGDLQAVLANVTSDPASVDAAIDNINGGITAPTHDLTAVKDVLNGGNGNDVFEALPIGADGKGATTFNTFDVIDGGAGRDTLNVYTDLANNLNDTAGGTVKNVEVVNIINGSGAVGGAAGSLTDASKYQGVQELWQVNSAATTVNLTNSVTAGFKDTGAAALSASTAAAATTANVAVSGVDAGTTLTVTGAKLDTFNLSGSLATKGALAATVTLGKDVQSATVNADVATTLVIENDLASTKDLTSVDASGSTAAIKYVTADAEVATIKSGSGNDELVIITATDKATSVNATLNAGAGNDKIEVATTGDGTTTIKAGAGDDTVNVTARSSGVLTLDLGAGDDTFSSSVAINGTDVIDGGAGTDTLLLQLVGVANVKAFSNFEVFDVIDLDHNLDVDILAQNNTVTEIVASGDVAGGASLDNLGAGVGIRFTGDDNAATANGTLSVTQKVAGALTISLDIDETGTTALDSTNGDVDGNVTATNATSITANFDSDFVGAIGAGPGGATDLNAAELVITGEAATSLTVASSGDNASNFLVYNDTNDKLASITITGDSALNLDLNASTKVATVDASGLSGGLTFNMADLKASTAGTFDGGVLKLGAGDDVITIVDGGKISSIGLGAGEDATAQDGFDVLAGAGTQAADNIAAGLKDGLVTFQGTGPTDLATAIADVTTLVGAGAAVFEYIGNSYIVTNGDVIQLVGVTGLHGLDNVDATTDLYVF
ncbi:MAG TPA: hypothetical protein VNR18_13020, partial [Hyphomicrobiales bacterium]|nr:hypothetical protein [Hyphomicrobiales bacterium]